MADHRANGGEAQIMHYFTRLSYNPLVIWLMTSLVVQLIGSVVVTSLIERFFLGGYGIIGGLTEEVGLCGSYGGPEDWPIVLCRLFYPKETVIIVFVPLLVFVVVPWLVMMLRARKFLFFVSRNQRWVIVSSMSALLFVYLIITASKTPQYILFTGPIYGFHPLLPLVKRGSSLLTVIVFWILVDFATRYRESIDGPKRI